MQETSDLYKELLHKNAKRETRLLVGNKNTPISRLSTEYSERDLRQLKTSGRLFKYDSPTVGDCVDSQIKIIMNYPDIQPPRMAKLVPQVRLTDGTRYSEWISKGVFFVDTRKKTNQSTSVELLTLTGFDAMLRTEQDYPSSKLAWPANDIEVVGEIADFIDVDIDPRTVEIMTKGYKVQYPGGKYSCRETLGYIAAMYGASFIMNDVGQLRLVKLNCIPKATNYLVDNQGYAITFGGVRILV